MRQNPDPRSPADLRQPDTTKTPGDSAIEAAAPPFNLPPLPKTRRAEVRLPASINGRDLSAGKA